MGLRALNSFISSWFVPTELDGRVGGVTTSHFAPDGSMDSLATISAWEPPHRFVAESDDTVIVEGNHYFPAGSVTPRQVTTEIAKP